LMPVTMPPIRDGLATGAAGAAITPLGVTMVGAAAGAGMGVGTGSDISMFRCSFKWGLLQLSGTKPKDEPDQVQEIFHSGGTMVLAATWAEARTTVKPR